MKACFPRVKHPRITLPRCAGRVGRWLLHRPARRQSPVVSGSLRRHAARGHSRGSHCPLPDAQTALSRSAPERLHYGERRCGVKGRRGGTPALCRSLQIHPAMNQINAISSYQGDGDEKQRSCTLAERRHTRIEIVCMGKMETVRCFSSRANLYQRTGSLDFFWED